MTRKHFAAVAAALGEVLAWHVQDPEGAAAAAHEMGRALSQFNARFNRDRFTDAVVSAYAKAHRPSTSARRAA